MFTVYGRTQCMYCTAAKSLLTMKEQSFTYLDIHSDLTEKEFDTIVTKNNHKTVPLVYLEDKFIGGYEELIEYLS